MRNYKVRVENIAEADTAQHLFEDIGYRKAALFDMNFPKLVVAVCNGDDKYSSGAHFGYAQNSCKELTIQQLRNLVAAKTKKIPYLVKTIDRWEEQQLTSDTPKSATCTKIPNWAGEAHLFNNYVFFTHLSNVAGNSTIIWQRATQPEELPFIDDEPKMTDIEQTLNERQSQYGDFSDVAETTQSLYLMLLNDDMTNVQRGALYMICSKLSRIKHGDCHKIDSWHDIGGYATLVVKDLEQNNG